MRWNALFSGLLSLVLAGRNIYNLWKPKLSSFDILDVFFINLSISIVCFFLNPDITNFTTLLFNGTSPWRAYDQGIVNSPSYFPESDFLFFMFCVSSMFSIISISVYVFYTRMHGKPPTPLTNLF
jgi:hypothetical protein